LETKIKKISLKFSWRYNPRYATMKLITKGLIQKKIAVMRSNYM
jgi:hypothetical protein